MRLDLFNTTAFRMSVGYTLLVTLAVGVTLGSAYLLTESLITDEVDLIIDTELRSLEEKFARSGLPGVRSMYVKAREAAARSDGSAKEAGSGTDDESGSACAGFVPHVTYGASVPASKNTSRSKTTPASPGSDRQ